MKKFFLSAVIIICIVVCAFVMPSSEGLAQNNDEKYDSYTNMLPNTTGHTKYIVPNLYRQDASYINVKTFPLVVNNSVEYFPLDIFALYPYLQVVYSKITHGFYINNTKNNHYVAFDMENGTTTTHDEQLLDIKAQIFNRTYYVPAQKVCEILEMNFETYDDPINGIRAARISDSKAKMTLAQLVASYSPVKIEPEVPLPPDSNTPPPNPPGPSKEDNTDIKEDTPKPVDPYTTIPGKSLYLCFDVKNADHTSWVLNTLHNSGCPSVFVVNKDKILAMPDTVRSIIAEGHSVAIGFELNRTESGDVDINSAIDSINETNEVLHLVAKFKTRYVVPAANYAFIDTCGFMELAEKNGLEPISDYITSKTNTETGLDTLISDLTGHYNSRKKTVLVRFGSERTTAGLVGALLRFTEKYPQFRIESVDEYAVSTVLTEN